MYPIPLKLNCLVIYVWIWHMKFLDWKYCYTWVSVYIRPIVFSLFDAFWVWTHHTLHDKILYCGYWLIEFVESAVKSHAFRFSIQGSMDSILFFSALSLPNFQHLIPSDWIIDANMCLPQTTFQSGSQARSENRKSHNKLIENISTIRPWQQQRQNRHQQPKTIEKVK